MEWREAWHAARDYAKANFGYDLEDGEGSGVQLLNRVCERSGITIKDMPDWEDVGGASDSPLTTDNVADVRPRFCASYIGWSTWTGGEADFDDLVPDSPDADELLKNRGTSIEDFYTSVSGAASLYARDAGPMNKTVRECNDMLGSLLMQIEQPGAAKEVSLRRFAKRLAKKSPFCYLFCALSTAINVISYLARFTFAVLREVEELGGAG